MSEPSWVPLGATGLNPPTPATPADDGKWLQAQGGAMVWQALPASGIQATIVDAKGDLIAATGADAVARLPVGANSNALIADSAQATGLRWADLGAQGYVGAGAIDAKGDILAGWANDDIRRFPVGTNGQVLTAQSAQASGLQWATPAASTISLVTALPGSPVDGDMVILTDSLTAPTFAWHLRYISAKATNKWIFVGGSPRYAEVLTEEAVTTGAFNPLTTAGPSVAVPVAGSYVVEQGAATRNSAGNYQGYMSYDIGGTGAVSADSVLCIGGEIPTSNMRRRVKTLTAVTLTSKYATAGGNHLFQNRWISIEPIAVGG